MCRGFREILFVIYSPKKKLHQSPKNFRRHSFYFCILHKLYSLQLHQGKNTGLIHILMYFDGLFHFWSLWNLFSYFLTFLFEFKFSTAKRRPFWAWNQARIFSGVQFALPSCSGCCSLSKGPSRCSLGSRSRIRKECLPHLPKEHVRRTIRRPLSNLQCFGFSWMFRFQSPTGS